LVFAVLLESSTRYHRRYANPAARITMNSMPMIEPIFRLLFVKSCPHLRHCFSSSGLGSPHSGHSLTLAATATMGAPFEMQTNSGAPVYAPDHCSLISYALSFGSQITRDPTPVTLNP